MRTRDHVMDVPNQSTSDEVQLGDPDHKGKATTDYEAGEKDTTQPAQATAAPGTASAVESAARERRR